MNCITDFEDLKMTLQPQSRIGEVPRDVLRKVDYDCNVIFTVIGLSQWDKILSIGVFSMDYKIDGIQNHFYFGNLYLEEPRW